MSEVKLRIKRRIVRQIPPGVKAIAGPGSKKQFRNVNIGTLQYLDVAKHLDGDDFVEVWKDVPIVMGE